MVCTADDGPKTDWLVRSPETFPGLSIYWCKLGIFT